MKRVLLTSDIATTDTPAEAMWEAYRHDVLFDMGDVSAGISRAVFMSGMAMAMAYFLFALHQDEKGGFENMMNKLDEELRGIAEEMIGKMH